MTCDVLALCCCRAGAGQHSGDRRGQTSCQYGGQHTSKLTLPNLTNQTLYSVTQKYISKIVSFPLFLRFKKKKKLDTVSDIYGTIENWVKIKNSIDINPRIICNFTRFFFFKLINR